MLFGPGPGLGRGARAARLRQRAVESAAHITTNLASGSPHDTSGDEDAGARGAGDEVGATGGRDDGEIEDADNHDGSGDEADLQDDDDEEVDVGTQDDQHSEEEPYEQPDDEAKWGDEYTGPDQDQAGKRPRWMRTDEDVRVDPPQTRHSDWASWSKYLDQYSSATMQVLPVKETMSCRERNKRTAKTNKAKLGKAVLIPEELSPYQRVYICTHGWPPGRAKTTGKRPRHHIRFTDCPFRFTVQWQPKDSGWQLQVKCGLFVHNHPVTPDTYGTYPTSRGVQDARVEARVDGMLAVGAKRSKIYDYLLEHDQNVIQSDVDNMVRAHSSSVSSKDDNDATAAEIAAFAAADPENVASIDETDTGETGVISLSTKHMRLLYTRFPELMLVDCTHKTNRYAAADWI